MVTFSMDRGNLHAPRPGDMDRDGGVDYDDVIEHVLQWGPCEDRRCPADLDGDHFVDMVDFLELLANLDRVPLIADARTTHRSL
jgi:hypothetical protein